MTFEFEKSPEFAEGQQIKMFSVYILRSPKNHLYVGSTSNLNWRIIRHKSGDGAEFTKRNKAFGLVYKEEFSTLLGARRREEQIKGWRREKKENLVKFGKPIL
ncbi:MAG: GIY-YIG nuclease family protein [bacterium]|nr:GIY-YIG nuclease family protein [bacterium]